MKIGSFYSRKKRGIRCVIDALCFSVLVLAQRMVGNVVLLYKLTKLVIFSGKLVKVKINELLI